MSHYEVNDAKGLEHLNKHLEHVSYIDGWNPTQNDVKLYEKVSALGTAPDPTKYAHITRWMNHIRSWSVDQRSSWPAGAEGHVHHAHGHDASHAGHAHTHEAHTHAPPAATTATPGAPEKKKEEDFDLFGEEDDAEHEALLEARRKEHEAKKAASGKPTVIAKSSVILDVKPWDDTTDLKVMEDKVRTIQMEGLHWGAAKKAPIGYGIFKLQIVATIVDDLVSVDDLSEKIQEFEDLVQSVDIAAFNKL